MSKKKPKIEEIEVENVLDTDMSSYQKSMVFLELARRNNTFDLLTAQRLLASLQFERLLNAIEEEMSNPSKSFAVNEQIKSMDKTLNDLVRLEIEKTSKKIVIGDVHVSTGSADHQQKIKQEYVDKWGEKTAKILNNPDSKRRVLNVLEMLRVGASGPVGDILNAEVKKEEV